MSRVADSSEERVENLSWELFRSQPMRQYKLCIPRSHAEYIMDRVIQAGVVHFVPPGAGHQKLFTSQILECAECDRKLRYAVTAVNEYLEIDGEQARRAEGVFADRSPEPTTSLSELSATLSTLEDEFAQNTFALRGISAEAAIKREHRTVLETAVRFLERARGVDVPSPPVFNKHEDEEGLSVGLMEQGQVSDFGLKHVCGMVLAERTERLRMALFRSCFGCVLLKVVHLDEPTLYTRWNTEELHDVIIVLFTSEETRERVTKICEAFDAHTYPVPIAKEDEIPDHLVEEQLTDKDLEDIEVVIKQTIESGAENCQRVAANLAQWTEYVRKEAILYETLNQCSHSSDYLYAMGWVPDVFLKTLKNSLQGADPVSSGLAEQLQAPVGTAPTFIPTSKYTACLQSVVDKYGIARYQELNPGLFCLVFFPFLFATMFGDILHGAMIMAAATTMIALEHKCSQLDVEVFQMIFSARYAILAMGACSVYMGFIYNDLAGIPLDLGTSYKVVANSTEREYTGSPYLFGVDPVWKYSDQQVSFTNSLKMKMSVIIGVTQMVLGIVLKMLNAHHFKDRLTLMHEAIPEMIFFVSTVGYMIGLIFIKWSIDWANVHQGDRGPPQIINVMINMAMMGTVHEKDVLIHPSSCTPGGGCSFQTWLQRLLVALALLSVPWMLLVKPNLLPSTQSHKSAEGPGSAEEHVSLLAEFDDDTISETMAPEEYAPYQPAKKYDHPPADQEVTALSPKGDDVMTESVMGESFELEQDPAGPPEYTEILVEQVIHTIEFVLGTISNTASYLRLWALSLAHAQLSDVFMEYIFMGHQFSVGVNADPEKYFAGGALMLLVLCTLVWLACTVGVLLIMESLSAFLHALRLQWVEFQGKFYKADGVGFLPTTFSKEDHAPD